MNNKRKDSKKAERILTFLQNKANLTYNKYTSWLVKNYLVYKWNVSTRVSQYSIENCTGCLWRYIILAINTSPLSLTYDLKTNEDCKQELWGRTDVRWKFSCISYFRKKKSLYFYLNSSLSGRCNENVPVLVCVKAADKLFKPLWAQGTLFSSTIKKKSRRDIGMRNHDVGVTLDWLTLWGRGWGKRDTMRQCGNSQL